MKMQIPNALVVFLLVLSGMTLWTSCYEEKFETGSGVTLGFSLDTLRFDTVFTEIGSATRSFRVYNTASLPVIISRIRLANPDTRFRINADGYQGKDIRDVEVPGNDSIWVFVEVTVNPDDPLSISPFVIEETIQFETNGNEQEIHLEAWGQNANYFPNRFHQNEISVLTCDLNELVWDDPKPYVIYGTLLVDSCTLVLPPGARVYVHGGIANNSLGFYNDGILYMLPDGKLDSRGTPEEPVYIQDDRLEEEYAGVWGGIRLGPGSGPHKISGTIIYNAIVAVSADSASSLTLDHVEIGGTSSVGLLGRHANVSAENLLVYANGSAGVAFTYGGNYQLDYCTIANYGNDAPALIVNNYYCTDQLCLEDIFFNKVECRVRNTIIVGSNRDELRLEDATPEGTLGMFVYDFSNCIVRYDELVDNPRFSDFPARCVNCLQYTFSDTLFVDEDAYDFHLDTLSMAEGLAQPIPGIPFDLDGNFRDSQNPDIGCYEYQYE